MAAATNTTAGQVLLAGDLSGTGSNIELRTTGVVPKHYSIPQVVIDGKGRIIFAQDVSSAKFTSAIPQASLADWGISKPGGSDAGLYANNGVLTTAESGAGIGTFRVDGTSLTVDGSDLLTPNLPIASTTTLGTVKIVNNAGLLFDATLGLSRYLFSPATTAQHGFIKPDSSSNGGFDIDTDGATYGRVASNLRLGQVKVLNDANTGGFWLGSNPSTDPEATNLYLTGNQGWGYVDPNVIASGSGLSIDSGGYLNFSGFDTSGMPTASASVSGLVKVGGGLAITSEGLLSVSGFQPATSSVAGTVMPDTNSFSVASGVITPKVITSTTAGTLKYGTGNIVDGATVDAIIYSVAAETTSPVDYDHEAQSFIGLRFSRATPTTFGVVKPYRFGGFAVADGILSIDYSGGAILSTNTTNTTTAYSVSHVTTLEVSNVPSSGYYPPAFYSGNNLQFTINGVVNLTAPLYTSVGGCYNLIIKKTTDTDTFTLSSEYHLNAPLNTSFTHLQALRLSLICIATNVFLTIQSDVITL